MVVFWILATLMTAVALAFVLVPLLRARSAVSPSRDAANLDVLRGQRREIDADLASGLLPADAKEEALAELVDRARADLEAAAPAPADGRKPWVTASVAALAIPLVAFGVYLAYGTPAATDPRLASRDSAAPVDAQRVAAMVEQLAVKVRERPDDAQGWALLARSMAALGRFDEAADAYARLQKLMPGNADVLADYADTLAMAQGATLRGRPYELARQALAIDPKHGKALALAGTAALDAGDFAGALQYWQALARELPPDSAEATQIRGVLAEVMTRAAAAGQVLAAPPPNAAPATPRTNAVAPRAAAAADASAARSISGSVAVAPALASRADPAATLFVFARHENGPRMPLAVLRASAAELPLRFTLDDSQAMSPATRLSSATAVRIEARISRSGNAAPQPGDLVGTSGVVEPGARDVKIMVDKVLP
jgi:cytochrome c-type biogenesis protein CcmH